MPRTQPCRKRLAIHARQLALKSRLQILRRSRRALLRGLEQARRSALAHHVHRIASMGARVLINGTWYNGVCAIIKLDLSLLKISTRLREAGDFREPAVPSRSWRRFSVPLYRSWFFDFAAAPRSNSRLSLFSISWRFCGDSAPADLSFQPWIG